jgi:hypothetical protein
VKRQTTALILAAAATTAVIAGTTASSAAPAQGTRSHAAQAADTVSLKMQPSSDDLKNCFPKAKANVKVKLTTDAIGFDTFSINASGLKPKTAFTVFLIEQPGSPFGHVEYIGDMFSDQYGSASNKFKLIVEEAFAFNNATQDRVDLNSVGFWFADPKDDDGCLGAGSPVTGFDGDASAGVQMMNSGSYKLP